MEAVDPRKAELDSLDFGTLCHAAFEAMGKNASIRESSDARTIRDFLLANLDRQMRGRFGGELTLPLQIQLESAKQRLSRAADVQAALRTDGWIIEHVEWPIELILADIPVRGTIDRIDRHEPTGAIRVFDYKTSDKPVNPREAHVRNLKRTETPESVPEFARFECDGRTVVWRDLQLPLYLRALAAEFPGPIDCGYFNLPKATTETGVAFWENYTPEIQEAADRCALGIVNAVKSGRFWPPSEDVDENYDEFATLFQHGVADSVIWQPEAQA
jgi:ATP-dependent helicase/nuclease subunit B